jgi:hypothetical protein
MFNTIIDAIQDSKKKFVTNFITDKQFQAELIKLVDAQTTFAKGSVQSSLNIAEAFVKNFNQTVYAKKVA